ncbi:MAG: hypothetical protein ABIG63_12510 [Chloroflexota bacterium]
MASKRVSESASQRVGESANQRISESASQRMTTVSGYLSAHSVNPCYPDCRESRARMPEWTDCLISGQRSSELAGRRVGE